MLSASHLACGRRGEVIAEGVDFELAPGKALQVEGANGSGKTTLLRTLAGLAPALRGTVSWQGRDIRGAGEAFRAALAYIGHDNAIEAELTAAENLKVLLALGGERVAERELHDALHSTGVEEEAWQRPARMLSQGQKRRVALARLWCTRKPLWLLDEPLAALDSRAVTRFESRLAAHLRSGGLAVIATHHPLLTGQSPQRLLLVAA